MHGLAAAELRRILAAKVRAHEVLTADEAKLAEKASKSRNLNMQLKWKADRQRVSDELGYLNEDIVSICRLLQPKGAHKMAAANIS